MVLMVSTITLAESDSSSACEGHNRVKFKVRAPKFCCDNKQHKTRRGR